MVERESTGRKRRKNRSNSSSHTIFETRNEVDSQEQSLENTGSSALKKCFSSEIQPLPSFLSTYLKYEPYVETQQDESCCNQDSQGTLFDLMMIDRNPHYLPNSDMDGHLSITEDKSMGDVDEYSTQLCEATHEYVWLKRCEGSRIHYLVVDIDYNPCVILKTTIEVIVTDGIILGTNCSLQDVLVDQSEYNPHAQVNFDPSVITFECIDNRFLQFRRLSPTDAFAIEDQFTVECFCLDSPLVCKMEGMNESSWTLLREVVEAARYLQRTGASDVVLVDDSYYSMTSELSGKKTRVRLALSTSWLSVIKPVAKSFEIFSCFRSLPEADKIILRKESAMEAAIIHMISNYDKEFKSRVYIGIMGHLKLCVRTKQFEHFHSFFTAMDLLMNDFDETLRRDEVVMSLLTLSCLLKSRFGVKSLDILVQNRRKCFDILDKYIRAKLASCEWTLNYTEIWDVIYKNISRIHSLKTVYENLSVSASNSS